MLSPQVKLTYLSDHGADKYAVIMPGETLAGQHCGGRYGARAYIVEGRTQGVYFPIIGSDDMDIVHPEGGLRGTPGDPLEET
eukprot:2822120-Pyramimonas_sp.AAC.1